MKKITILLSFLTAMLLAPSALAQFVTVISDGDVVDETSAAKGTHYLKLDVENQKVIDSDVLDRFCIWYMSGPARTGFYYQHYGTNTYYLDYPDGLEGQAPVVIVVADGDTPPPTLNRWYNWDWGVALERGVEGQPSYRSSFLSLGQVGAGELAGKWVMSCNNWYRPEWTYTPAGGQWQYNCYQDADHKQTLLYHAGTTNICDVTHFDAEAVSSTGGLADFTLDATELKYQEIATASIESLPTYNSSVRPAYTQVDVTSVHNVTGPWYNRHADTTIEMTVYYYDNDAEGSTGWINGYGVIPDVSGNAARAITSINWTKSGDGKDYVKVVPASGTQPMSATVEYATRRIHGDVTVTLTATVNYDDGTHQEVSKNITLKSSLAPGAESVGGFVFGGGRMADVKGSTDIEVINSGYIAGVFGGNDISGRVQTSTDLAYMPNYYTVDNASGSKIVGGGSRILIGKDGSVPGNTSDTIIIGYVYGGGNGYYDYVGVVEGADMDVPTFNGNVYEWGKENDEGAVIESGLSDAYIPAIPRSYIMINSKYAHIDSVFGGAKNAYMNGYASDGTDTMTSIVMQNAKGAVYAMFGGNNVGGKMKADAHLSIQINGTNYADSDPGSGETLDGKLANVANTDATMYGLDFGIRYLFGGGNKVDAPKVHLWIRDGQIDTIYGGGNEATVAATDIDVNCNTIIHQFLDDPGNYHWSGSGYYNIRCLFGGNNKADMDILPNFNIRKGGIATIYGGGNKGNMKASDDSRESNFTKLGTHLVIDPVKETDLYIDYVYGGCRMSTVDSSAYVRIANGNLGTVFGGCNISGNVGSAETGTTTTTNVIMTGGTVYRDVFGGANGQYHCNDRIRYIAGVNFKDPDGNELDSAGDFIGMSIPHNKYVNTNVTGGTIKGNLYGGGNMADVGTRIYKKGRATLRVGVDGEMGAGPIIEGNVFAGGNMASIYGRADVLVNTCTILGSLYAGNDKTGSIEPYVGAFTEHYLEGTPSVTTKPQASNGDELDENNASAYLRIIGKPTIARVFGGGNGDYDYRNMDFCTVTSTENPLGVLVMLVQTSTYVDINTKGGYIDTIYGGGNKASVTHASKLLVNIDSVVAAETADGLNGMVINQDRVDSDSCFVGTLFGANNSASTFIVPEISLLRGTVMNVFGGGNAGSLNAEEEFFDICGNAVSNVSGHVVINSPNATITGNLFAGCNHANVAHTSFVEVYQTSEYGIHRIFGGNDISGKVVESHVDIIDGVVKEIYGGSNGHYDYVANGSKYDVYEFGHARDANYLRATKTSGIPNVNTTRVRVLGGDIMSSVYGGGFYGNCQNTYVVVNDTICGRIEGSADHVPANIYGNVYGGGCGNYSNAGIASATHYGNVTGKAQTDLYHANELSGAMAYGGGRAGDVGSTLLTLHPGWDLQFTQIYGGCYGSNVRDSAKVVFNCTQPSDGYNANYVFGGNDFTGNVKKSIVDIYDGAFLNVFGAGNGAYDDVLYTDGLTVPNCEDVIVYVKKDSPCKVAGNMYGGGLKGTVYKKSAGVNSLAAAKTKTSSSSLDDYAHILMEIHGGRFDHNIFAGCQGVKTGTAGDQMAGVQIAYALKQVDMDGGEVVESVYGGSENVDDGYPGECISITNTTMRPSSILNITGGSLGNNVYGGGYVGMIYGSVYINIGKDAVANSPVWTKSYGSTSYADYKPNNSSSARRHSILKANDLFFNASIYNGANWGEGVGEEMFTNPGFTGGESNMLIDGAGYNTTLNPMGSSEPAMNIELALIGSGTSCEGGDISRLITLLNYGVKDACGPSKRLKSVQRCDRFISENTAVLYEGSNDAVSIYASNNYSLNRIHNVIFRGYNLVEIGASVDRIDSIEFQKTDGTLMNTAADLTAMRARTSSDYCTASPCEKRNVIDPSEAQYTMIVIRDGMNINVCNAAGVYGPIQGFGYLLQNEETGAVVQARNKTNSSNATDGGFFSTCSDELWTDPAYVGYGQQLAYNNYSDKYRAWTLGSGRRTRQTVILAHSDVSKLSAQDKILKIAKDGANVDYAGGPKMFAVAKATIELPPALEGSYYRIEGGINVEEQNGEMVLVNTAWYPYADGANNFTTLPVNNGSSYVYNDQTYSWGDLPVTSGQWKTVAGETHDETKILQNPKNTFGLLMVPEQGFSDSECAVTSPYVCNDETTITGNSMYTTLGGYNTHIVTEDQIMPKLDFYLTYSTGFPSTINGTVKFTLREYVPDRRPGHEGEMLNNGTIDVIVAISTIIDQFRSDAYEVVAMNNEGRRNTFVRKMLLPASLQRRELYLKAVQWEPYTEQIRTERNSINDPAIGDLNNFKLTDVASKITGHNDVFGISFRPSESLTDESVSVLGWYTKEDKDFNLVTEAEKGIGATHVPASTTWEYPGHQSTFSGELVTALNPADIDNTIDIGYATNNSGKGTKIGELDGRSAAAIDLTLHFDGTQVYGEGDVGMAVMTFDYYVAGVYAGSFNDTVVVKTRTKGDTIYLASAQSITRNGITLTPYGDNSDYTNQTEYDASGDKKGKTPRTYLRTFAEAMASDVYEFGDVIAIMDTVNICEEQNLTIRGTDYVELSVVRYSGSHYYFPGDDHAYYGPLIHLTDKASFSFYNVDFDGSAIAKKKPIYNTSQLGARLTGEYSWTQNVSGTPTIFYSYKSEMQNPDTLVAHDPMFLLENNSTLTIANNSSVRNCWNGVATNSDAKHLGSVASINDTARLITKQNVNIYDNFAKLDAPYTTGVEGEHPTTGAIQLNSKTATFEIGYAATNARQIITENRLTDGTSVFWQDTGTGINKHFIYKNDTSAFPKSNVFLNRTPDALPADQILKDDINNMIVFGNRLPAGTRIGISKWFPGSVDADHSTSERDTIRVAYSTTANPSLSLAAFNNHNFISDNPAYDVVYNYNVGAYTIYLHRCATFKKQVAGLEMVDGHSYTRKQTNVIEYSAAEIPCPTGGDIITYNVRGGFYPYTYTWTEKTATTQSGLASASEKLLATNKKSTANSTKDEEIAASPSGTLPTVIESDSKDAYTTDDEHLGNEQFNKWSLYSITATDLFGCKLTKKVQIDYHLTTSDGLSEGTGNASLSDTNGQHTATITRNYIGVELTTQVMPEYTPVAGTIYVYPNAASANPAIPSENAIDLTTSRFCMGNTLHLRAIATDASKQFITWDFNNSNWYEADYVIPAVAKANVTAFFGGSEYWKNHINEPSDVAGGTVFDENFTYNYASPTGAGYVTTYNGDVHIYNESGLAWFISVVNGLNGTQARPFFYNYVYLHKKNDGTAYDMKDYLWTPVGSMQHRFRGHFLGVPYSDINLLTNDTVIIKNIILNEPNMDYVGFFGFLDSARVYGISLQNEVVVGSQYVGGIAASAKNTQLKNVSVVGETGATESIIATNYTSGGMIGKSEQTRIDGGRSKVRFMGDAVYSGGVVGYAESTRITNNEVKSTLGLNGLYVGGTAGYLNGTSPSGGFFGLLKSGGEPSQILNNYVHIANVGEGQVIGGLAGYAKNTKMENNYVYGTLRGTVTDAGASAVIDGRVSLSNNYYEKGSTNAAIGVAQSTSSTEIGTNTAFKGTGNRVSIDESVYGVNNLTRVLNTWVRKHNVDSTEFRTWRSDLDGLNNGYPMFGEPDMIPVYDTMSVENCEQVEWNGEVFSADTTININTIDSLLMIDSTMHVRLIVHHGTHTDVTDTVAGRNMGYSGYGFSLSAAEIMLLRSVLDSTGRASIVLYDTLTSEFGCDSIVRLTLTVDYGIGIEAAEGSSINVYPNPTTSMITVEADNMSHVEVYDNDGRSLADYDARGDNKICINLTGYSTGVYFLRVHTPQRVTIQKVIKK